MTLALIESTFPILDEWQELLAEVFVPSAGSELDADDSDWPPVRASQVVVMGLGSARDHLKAVRVSIEAGQLFPYAQLTLVRGALVGAAQAVWVLSPDMHEERILRARLVADHMYTEHSKYLRLLRELSAGQHETTEDVAAFVAQRGKELKEVRANDNQKRTLDTTAMVSDAALAAFGDRATASEVIATWRLTSGAAHGFAWALVGQPGTALSAEPVEDGMTVVEAGGAIDRIANHYLGSFALARHGFWLLKKRSEPA